MLTVPLLANNSSNIKLVSAYMSRWHNNADNNCYISTGILARELNRLEKFGPTPAKIDNAKRIYVEGDDLERPDMEVYYDGAFILSYKDQIYYAYEEYTAPLLIAVLNLIKQLPETPAYDTLSLTIDSKLNFGEGRSSIMTIYAVAQELDEYDNTYRLNLCMSLDDSNYYGEHNALFKVIDYERQMNDLFRNEARLIKNAYNV